MPDFAPGTPSWVDVSSPDLEASRAFYGGLFGWEAWIAPQEEAGGYTMFASEGKTVAGLGPTFSPDQPPAWATYIATADVDATKQAVTEAGGTIVVEPMTVLDAGRMAVFTDNAGAHFCVWQAGTHRGAEKVNEPNSFSWNELATRDIDGAKTFYGNVFGWASETHDMGNGQSYTEWKLDGRSIGGGMAMGDQYPTFVPPHWLTYFTVEDTDATIARALELGGKVTMPAMDIPQGRFAVLQDNHGATFAVIAMPKA